MTEEAEHHMIVCMTEDIMPTWDQWQQHDRDVELHLHFHPEESRIDPGELDTYSYFHPETVGAMRLI